MTGATEADWAPASAEAAASKMPRARRILIVGAGQAGRTLAEQLDRRPDCVIVGFIEDDPSVAAEAESRVLGGRDDIFRIMTDFHVDEVVVAYAPSWQQQVAESLVNGHSHVKVKVVPTLYETMIAKPQFRTVDDVPLIDLDPPRGLPYSSRIVKRGFDIAVSTALLVLSLPVSIAAAVAIKMTSRGPVLFAQERVGRNGRRFKCLKFRTMVADAESKTGPVLSSGKDDPRVTKVGRFLRKTRIDEIPNFLNVLLGHMSVVGPRPERVEFVEEFRKTVTGYDERHKVRPGITGLAQVHGYYLTNVHTKLRYDLMYVYNQSLLLDTKILLKTLREMVFGVGS
jgi:exopolysaccharide biosynthesis polyprenyl glycosylphosphotransferase